MGHLWFSCLSLAGHLWVPVGHLWVTGCCGSFVGPCSATCGAFVGTRGVICGSLRCHLWGPCGSQVTEGLSGSLSVSVGFGLLLEPKGHTLPYRQLPVSPPEDTKPSNNVTAAFNCCVRR